MFYLTFLLRRAVLLVWASPCRLLFVSNECCSTLRTMTDETERVGLLSLSILRLLLTCYLWNDLSAFLHPNHVAFGYAELSDEVFVMQCGTTDGGAAELNGCEVGYGSDDAGATYLVGDTLQLSELFLGLELKSDSPARCICGEALAFLQTQVVDLEHYTVGGNGQVLTLFVPVVDELHYLIDVLAHLDSVRDVEAHLSCKTQAA